jgi:hypothetical protein
MVRLFIPRLNETKVRQRSRRARKDRQQVPSFIVMLNAHCLFKADRRTNTGSQYYNTFDDVGLAHRHSRGSNRIIPKADVNTDTDPGINDRDVTRWRNSGKGKVKSADRQIASVCSFPPST